MAGNLRQKAILILEEKRYDYQRALSDISGWDIEVHNGRYDKAIAVVRSWLVAQASAQKVGTSRILQKYFEFQQWYWEQQIAAGSTEEDIREYPTGELINAMHAWMAAGQPL